MSLWEAKAHAIGLVSVRELAPVMVELRRIRSLNVVGMKALAAASYLHADVSLNAKSPKLQEAVALEHLEVQVHE